MGGVEGQDEGDEGGGQHTAGRHELKRDLRGGGGEEEEEATRFKMRCALEREVGEGVHSGAKGRVRRKLRGKRYRVARKSTSS